MNNVTRRSLVRVLGLGGIAGPVTFVVVALAHSMLRADHSLMNDPISALSGGASGWIQDVNFLVFGALMIAYAVGLHMGVRSQRWGTAGLAFLILSGVGLVWAFFFPAVPSTNPMLHTLSFIITFLGAGIGLITMSRRMIGDPLWQNVASYALGTGIATLLLLVAGAVLVRPPTAPLHPWWGLFQWVLLAIWLPITVRIAVKLTRVARPS